MSLLAMWANYMLMMDKDKLVKRELLVALKGELYFVKFIINPKEEDVEPSVILGREELEKDLWEWIMILSEKRSVIETLKYSEKHKKSLDSVLLDKLKLDEELELEEVEENEEIVIEYKAIKEKKDTGVFVLPIWLRPCHSVSDGISTLDHSEAKPMGILKDVLYKVGITMILAKFLILDISVDRDVPIFHVAEVKNNLGESDGDNKEDYFLKRDKMGKPLYGPNCASYLNCDDPMDHALALQETLNPFKKYVYGKKSLFFLARYQFCFNTKSGDQVVRGTILRKEAMRNGI
nr:hypothetical protein [Tanacetum cinerariifolium]